MTNEEIIKTEAVLNGLYTEKEIEEYVAKTGELPLHTYNVWRARGYAPKKGSKGIYTKLWKQKKVKGKDDKESVKFIKVTAILFSASQVEEKKKDIQVMSRD